MNRPAKPEGLFRALALSFFLRVISRGISVVKNALTAAFYGLAPVVDYFSIANGISIFFFAFQESFEFFSTREMKAAHDRQETSAALYRILALSFALSFVILAFVLLFLGPLLAVFGAGLSAAEQALVRGHVLCMLPGAFLTLPSAAISVVMRSSRQYSRSFAVDIFISGSIVLALVALRTTNYALVISYSVGQLIGFLFLLKQVWPWLKNYQAPWASLGPEFRDFLLRIRPLLPIIVLDQLYVAVEKYCGTKVGPGFLASITYAALVPVLVINLPAFANIFSVHVGEADKEEKFNDFLAAIGLYAIPATAFIFFFCPEILALLIGYGKLARESLEPVTKILRLLSFTFFFGLAQQIYGRIFFLEGRWLGYLAPFAAGRLVAMLALFTLLDTEQLYIGVALFYLATPVLATLGGMVSAPRLGYRLRHATLRFLLKISFAAFLAAWILAHLSGGSLLGMMVSGVVFVGVIAACVWLIREEFTEKLRGRAKLFLR